MLRQSKDLKARRGTLEQRRPLRTAGVFIAHGNHVGFAWQGSLTNLPDRQPVMLSVEYCGDEMMCNPNRSL